MANFRHIGTDFSNGLRAPHYTNGRLVTAEDLESDQRAILQRLAAVGQGVGYGVIRGFRVTAVSGGNSLEVTAGTGINRHGDLVQLMADTATLPVQAITEDAVPLRRAGRFESCNGDDTPEAAAVEEGAYLLTIAPLARLEGSVPRQTCEGDETALCANQWEVEGAEFKIVRLAAYQPPVGNQRNRNRNLLAHWLYGSDQLADLMRDPFRFDPAYTGFAQIAADDLTDCDLPLAAFFWADGRIAFADEWSARRRLIHSYPNTEWRANISDQRVAEGEARFLQFQEEIANLQDAFRSQTRTIRAVDRFAYLPPVGYLPVNPFELVVTDVFEQSLSNNHLGLMATRQLTQQQVLERVRAGVLSSMGSDTVFNLDRFFGDLLPNQYRLVHEDEIHDQLQLSWVQSSIALPAPPQSVIGPVTSIFDFVLRDGTLVTVNEDNVGTIADSLRPATSTSGFTFLANPVGRIRNPSFRDDVSDDIERDPLVDILVVDALLAPYREQLAEEMLARIDDAITSLSSGGDTFIGSNTFAARNAAISHTLQVNTFLASVINTGFGRYTDWLRLLSSSSESIFYVVFIRHRPTSRSRLLRL